MDLGLVGGRTRWARRWHIVLPAVTVLMSVPYAIAGPGFFLDDWFALRAGRIDGWYMAAGSEQWAARPGAGVVYALTFGLLQDRPLAYFLVAVALMAIASVLLFVICRRLTKSNAIAGAIALVWLLSPNHGSLEMWPSALNILLALVLALTGVERLTSADPPIRTDLASAGLLAAGTLTYEAVAPISLGAVIFVAVRYREGPRRTILLAGGLGAVGLALAWMALNWHPGKKGVDQWLASDRVVTGHLGEGIFGPSVVGQVVGVGVLVAITAIVGRRVVRGEWADARTGGLLASGAGVVVIGALPFVRYFYAPVGFGDRVTVVSGIGGAVILVGTAMELRALRRPLAVVAIAVCAVVAIGWRWEQTATYGTAADDGRRVLSEVENRFPQPPERALVFGPYPVLKHNVGPFLQLDWAVHWLYGTRAVEARTTFGVEEFEEADRRYRFDLIELSNVTGTVTP